MARQRKDETPINKRSKGDQVYLDAERDFIYYGLDLSDIAEKYNVPENTVRMWHYKYCWLDLRLKHNANINKELFKETAQETCNILQVGFSHIKEVLLAINDGLVYLRSLKTDKDEIPVVLKHIKAYQELSKLSLTTASMYNAYKPEISAEQGEKLIESVQKIKQETKKEEKKIA